MATLKTVEWEIDHRYDPRSSRHYNDGAVSVLHCHHYLTLYCQLADDAEHLNGKGLLVKAAEMAFLPILKNYFEKHRVQAIPERIALAEEYWRLCGLGLLSFDYVGEMTASAHMDHSHVDEGWIKKWGTREKPVNFVGQGYIAAAMAAVFDRSAGSYAVNEIASIVSGDARSEFSVVRV